MLVNRMENFLLLLKRFLPRPWVRHLKAFRLRLSASVKTSNVYRKMLLWRQARAQFWITRRKARLVETFPAYAPGSRGDYRILAEMTMRTVNRLPTDLAFLAKTRGEKIGDASSVEQAPADLELELEVEVELVSQLEALLNHYGSDKVHHGYHLLYSKILRNKDDIGRILEVGIGTNNEDTVSHMTSAGRPGASLRAFRDFCPNAHVFGADVDRRILFQDDRISTFWVDQLSSESLSELKKSIPGDFDLVIDDGLHSPDANISTLILGLALVKVGGWIVIEDIKPAAKPIWEVVAALLPEGFEARILEAKFELVFAVERMD